MNRPDNAAILTVSFEQLGQSISADATECDPRVNGGILELFSRRPRRGLLTGGRAMEAKTGK